ncbi:PAS domain S-box-containing protein [Bradyrhizobium erythrophlei]|nr:PAS domain S-box-containing protein [Bradyrhizobium erythrophlei]
MKLASQFGTEGDDGFKVLWEDGDRVFCRGWRLGADGNRGAVLAVLPAAEQPTPTSLARLMHEYGLKDELDGAWAVMPLELLRERGRTILVLEDHGGEPLEHLLGEPMEVGRFLRLAVSLSAALRRLHERGLVHKDIKPANVLVSSAGEIRLTGFGIASRLPRERQAPDPPEIIGGTLAYMAPEQTGRMNRSIDARSDLYSLGVTFYQMLAGSLPFSASDPMEWVHCHIARHPTPPNERVNAVPAPVAAIVLKLLAKNAESRYQTAAGVESDLQRCLSALDAHGRIESFPLAANDASDRLLIPEKLYGREAEIENLFAAFDRVVTSGGMTEIVLISGYAGIGKSSVVNELHKVLVPPRGLFASGKFDQYKRDIPYATLAQAFQSLVRQLLSKNDEEISRWRRHLLEAVGSNGQLMVNLIPELALIMGEQPPVPELPPQEDHNRFQRVFRRFLGVFARPEHPLALFLDDLQWLDTATLEMLEHLATHPEVRHLLLVGAYRDNEVGPSHPLRRILGAIRAAGARVQETLLAPLNHEAVEQMVADSLHCDQVSAQPLASVIHQKTEGNPFFAIQFFTALSEEGLLQYDPNRAKWTWDVSRIRAKGFSENVVDFIAVKLGRLSDTTRKALGQLACLGNVAQIATMTVVHGEPEEKIHAALWEAVLAGLIFRVNGAYRFLHDRVHEAAYGLIPESERPAAHLRIGRVLAASTAPDALEDAIFDIVNHLNRGAALILAQDERERVVTLNLMAGKRAKSSTAYASARNYLAQATALLSSDAWIHRHAETFELYLLLSECEYLAGNFEAADALFEMILGRASSDLDRAKVHSLRIKLYQVAGKYDQGLAVALNALRSFGVTFPEIDQDINAAVEVQFRDIPINLAGRPIGELLEAAVAADPVKRTVINLLVDMAPCAYIAQPSLFPLVALEAVNRSMRDGNTDQSSYVYGVFAVMLVSFVGDINSAYQFSELSLRLNERFNNPRLRGTLLHLHGDHVNFWRRHFATGLPILEQAFAACLEAGDLVYAGFLAFETVWQLVEKGDVLEDVLSSATRYAAFARQSRNDAVFETIRLEQQFVASLQGRTKDPLSFDDGTFDEAACLAIVVKAAFGCGIVFYHIMKQILAVIYGRYEEAMEATAEAEPVLGAAMAMPIEATYHFCHALTLTALYPTVSMVQQEHYRQLLDEKLKKLRLWADNCPENYRNRYALVSAEIARIEGRDVDAMRLYEEAIRLAHENGFVQNEAIASELAGHFYLAVGLETNGYAHLRNARACFALWGADGKVRQLESRHPRLAAAEGHPRTETMDAAIQKLDVTAIVKASQAVSSEIELPKLIERLMTVALENAGADRGLLILPQANGYCVEAMAEVSGGEIVLGRGSLSGDDTPDSLVRYVIRTRESVILGDARRPNPFAGDEYLIRRQPRSVFCLPLVRQTALAGVLYLENTLTSDAFTPDRTALLGLLASQLAISLENTRLYSDLREREAKIRRLVDANIIGIFIWDLDGHILEANEALLCMLGYDREDLASNRLRWTDLTPPEWRDRTARAGAEIGMTGAVQPFEKEYFRKDGSRMPVLVGSAAFDEQRDQGVAFVLDLTERKRAEAEARESEQRYREMQMELAHANRVATMGQLTASIAHEVKQPISAAVVNAQAALHFLARRPPKLEEVREALERIVERGHRAGDVVDRIRALIKKAPQRKERLDVNAAIREVIELTRAEAVKNCVSVQTDFADGLPLIEGDRVQLQQVILNLIMNAVEAMSGFSDGTRQLLIRTREAERGGVLVAVRDWGPGLEAATLARLFDAFYTTKSGGLGMGLSISRSIIEAHGGRLWASANVPHGATFEFTVPAHSDGAS